MERAVEKAPIKEIRPIEEFPYTGSWHKTYNIPLDYLSLTVTGTITGCGLAQMSGVTSLNHNSNRNITKENFIKKFNKIKQDGAGGIICTLGDGHLHNESRLLELGFEKLSKYANYRHGKSGFYKQTLYILKL